VRLWLQTPHASQPTRSDSLLLIFLPVGFGLLFTLTTTTTSGALLQSITEEKEDRVIEILLTSVRPGTLIAGKVLGLTALALTQLLVWLGMLGAALWLFSGGRPNMGAMPITGGLALPLAVYFVGGYLLIAACYTAVGATVRSPQEGYTLVAPISVLSLAPLLLLFVILARPSGPLAIGLSLFPFTAPLTMLMRLPLVEVPTSQMLLSLGLMGLATVLALRVAARGARRLTGTGILDRGRADRRVARLRWRRA
jgi:ABC-2 type transport system permease protein